MITFFVFTELTAATIFDGVVSQKLDPGTVISKIMPVVWWFAVILTIIYIAYAGFQYTTSNGDGNKISEAKSAIFNGVIGLAVTLSVGIFFRIVLGWI
jgi:hypothetical protein